VIVDQNDQDVLNGGNQIIDQPLAAAVFYRAKVLGDYAMVTMPNGTVIKIKGVSTGGLQVLFSHLPDEFNQAPLHRRLGHFEHYYGLLSSFTHRYPGLGNGCTGGLNLKKTFETQIAGGPPDIEPIYCPPAMAFEA